MSAQHLEALKHGNQVRFKQVALLRDVTAGTVSAGEILHNPPEEAEGLSVGRLLGAQVRWGRVKVGDFLLARGIPESRLIREMPPSQRVAVANDLADPVPWNHSEPRELRVSVTTVRSLGAAVRAEAPAGYALLSPEEAKAKARQLDAAADSILDAYAEEERLKTLRCNRGHLISEVGRTKSGNCRACKREDTQRAYQPRVRTELAIPVKPFAEWLRENVPEDGISAWARERGLDSSYVRRVMDGEQETVHLNTVDRALLDSPFGLWELYPDLYPDVELEAA